MKRVAVSLVCLLVLSTVFPPESVNATPLYKKVFDELYRSRFPGPKTTCAVCHTSKSKQHLNRYGTALAEELGEKGVTDRERIRQAMKAIEHRFFPGLPESGD
jgi:hypothetical protein